MDCSALSSERLASLVDAQQYVDHRASGAFALLAYTHGALPSPRAGALDRRTPQLPSRPRQLPSDVPMGCAVCRLALQELALAATLALQCPAEAGKHLARAPDVVCEHMASTGLLGHTEASVGTLHPLCDGLVQRHSRAWVRALSRWSAEWPRPPLLNNSGELCATSCERLHPATMPGWPAVMQLLLDADGASLHPSLRPGGRAATALESTGGDVAEAAEAASTQCAMSASGEAGECSATAGTTAMASGAARQLLLLAAARSDSLAVKLLCAFGLCSGVASGPGAHAIAGDDGGEAAADALAAALADATPAALHGDGGGGGSKKARARARAARQQLRQQARRRMLLHWAQGGGGGGGGVSAAHVAAYLLDHDTLRTLLVAWPGAATVRDGAGRTPLHFCAHGRDAMRSAVYLFTPQPFTTWLERSSASAVGFAPPHTARALQQELSGAREATAELLLRHGADAAAADDDGVTPLHLAAEAGDLALISMLHRAVGAAAGVGVAAHGAAETGAAVKSGAALQAALLVASDGVGRRAVESAAAGGEAEALALLLQLHRRHTNATEPEAGAGAAAEVGHLWEQMVRGKGSAVSPEDAEALLGVSPSSDGAEAAQREEAQGAEAAEAAEGTEAGGARCDLEVRHSAELSVDDFFFRYALQGRPLLLRDATESWPGRDALRRAPFLRAMGDAPWQPQYLLRGNVTSNLTAYLEAAAAGEVGRPLAFNRPLTPRGLAEIHAHVRWPRALTHRRLVASTLAAGGGAGLEVFVGPRGAGLPMHHHGAVWNGLAYGRKLWALERPAHARFAPAQQHPLDSPWYEAWAAKREAPRGVLLCEQRQDDAIFLPSGWAHATLNLEESLSVGGFLHDDRSLGLHFQLMHAPRGIGTLQSAATAHAEWYRATAAAFPPDEVEDDAATDE